MARRRVMPALALVAALLLGLVGLASPRVARAGSCTVTTLADSGGGSLRDRLGDAGCDTIAFDVAGTIQLNDALTPSHEVTVTGPGADKLTISGNRVKPVLNTFGIGSAAVAISGVTISNGNPGIANWASLALTNVVVRGNAGSGSLSNAGGIDNAGSLTMLNTTVSGNTATDGAGGVNNGTSGRLTVTNSAIVGNTSTGVLGHGGLANLGTATIAGTTISGNTAGWHGGGIYNNQSSGQGGLTVTNSTISGNTAGGATAGNGGALYSFGKATLRFTTVALNRTASSVASYTGGIYSLGGGNDVALLASVVVGNQATGADKDCQASTGTITSQGYNVVGVGTGCPSGGNGDTTAGGAGTVLSAALADNGGPTQTHALAAGSPAIDRVPASACGPAGGVDQRGTARPAGAACDSGAYEGGAAAPPPGPPLPPGTAPRCFAETGKCVRGPFADFWQAHGGLAINGFPISDEFTEALGDGKAYTVQYFERVRMEYHPENADPQYQVLLGQFGRTLHPADPAVAAAPGMAFYDATGHNVPPDFQGYWQAHGGLAQFGFPLSEVIEETLEDGRIYEVQYFERARFERHPENADPQYQVLLGQFGRRILGNR